VIIFSVLSVLSFASNDILQDTSLKQAEVPSDSSNSQIRVMCVGDIMTHLPLVQAAKIKNVKRYDFSSSFEMVSPLLKQADIVIGNLETVLAGDKYKLTGYPSFNGPQVLAFNLKNAGFTVLTTANNHSFDKSIAGVKNTLHFLDSAGLMHTGTYSDTGASVERCLILTVKSCKIGIFSYTYGINGTLSKKSQKFINIIDTVTIAKDLEYIRSKNVSIIIASIHFGIEYTTIPNDSQRQLVNFLWNNGVSIIFGHHSHVLQPMVFDTSNNRFAIFSLGNFMSNQHGNNREFGGIADLILSNDSSQVKVISAVMHPTCMYQWIDKKRPRYSILLLEDLLAKKSPAGCPEKVYKIADTMPFIVRQFHALDGKFFYAGNDTITASGSSR
jgi:poly-gamma-glutamate capsule biosynthesis protein CapA/YwtB (metallophosphatase superfamily)